MRWILVGASSLVLCAGVLAESITVSAAISLKEPLEDIGRAYEMATGEKVEFNFGASGQLMMQIRRGAPADGYIAAGHQQVKALREEALTTEDEPLIVTRNRLVLIVPRDARIPIASFEDLRRAGIHRISIGQPRTVPAGEYAREALVTMKLWDAVADRLVFGSNVRHVLDYVSRGEVEAGVVYVTDARQAGDRVRVVAAADEATHSPIEYPAVVVRSSRRPAAAKRFLDYLITAKAQAVFIRYGFEPGGRRAPATSTAPSDVSTATAPAPPAGTTAPATR